MGRGATHRPSAAPLRISGPGSSPLIFALALPLALSSAWAAPATSSLSWVRLDGAESCVAAPELAAAVEARLGRSVFRSPAEATLAVEGRAERVGGAADPVGSGEVRWRAVLRLTDRVGAGLGDRTVESRAETCAELGDVVAVTLALMIDPVTAPDPPPDLLPEPASAPSVLTPAPRWGVDAHLALTGGYGVVPGVAIGGSASVLLTPPGFVPLLATGDLVPFSTDAAGNATFSRATGGLQLCPADLRRGAFLVRACVGVDVGALVAVRSSEPLRGTEKLLAQGRASLRPSWRVWGPLLVDFGLHLLVPFRAVEFTTTDSEAVYRPAPVAVLGELGAGVGF